MIQTSPLAKITEIIAALKADTALNAYLLATFGRGLTFFVGVDESSQPTADQLPLMALRPAGTIPAEDRTHRLISLAMALVVSEGAGGVTTVDSVVTLDGLALLEGLYFAVERALEAIFAGDEYNFTATYESGSLDVGRPNYRVTWTVTIQGDY